jgi:hypothetical protein
MYIIILDVLVKKSINGCLSHMVYRNPTYTDVCSHVQCEHFPAQNWAVLSSPIHCARSIFDTACLEEYIFIPKCFMHL